MAKHLRHSESVNNPKYIHKVKYTVEPHVIHQQSQELDEDTNRVKTTIKYVTRQPDDLKAFKVSDFFLDNLKLAGALDNLKNINLTRDPLSASAHATNVANQIINSSNNE